MSDNTLKAVVILGFFMLVGVIIIASNGDFEKAAILISVVLGSLMSAYAAYAANSAKNRAEETKADNRIVNREIKEAVEDSVSRVAHKAEEMVDRISDPDSWVRDENGKLVRKSDLPKDSKLR